MTVMRDAVPIEHTWDAAGVFPTVAAWESELEAVLSDLSILTAFQGRLGESAAILVEALHIRDELARRAGRVSVYALMGYAVETSDTDAVARFGRAQAAEAQVSAATAFVDPEVLGLGEERLRDWSVAQPALRVYEHYVADLVRRAAHLRSAEVEEVLGLTSDAFSGPFSVYSALADSDLVFAPAVATEGESFEVTQGSIDELLGSPDRMLRRRAWESYADGYLGMRNTLAANLSSTIKQAVFSTRVRRHASPLAASLSASNVPVEVFDNLIAAFEVNLPTWHRYWHVRRSIDGVEQFNINGAVAWEQKTVSIPAGSHALRWRYAKDGSVSIGSDAGWVDQVTFTAAGSLQVSISPAGAVSAFWSSTFNASRVAAIWARSFSYSGNR